MIAKLARNMALTEPLARFIYSKVAEGLYSSAGELVCAALRLLKRKDASVRPTKSTAEAARG